MNKMLFLQGALYTTIGALTPVSGVLASNVPLTSRVIAVLVITGIIAGSTSLKAFLSTTFAESPASVPPPKREEPPAPVIVANPEPISVTEAPKPKPEPIIE